MKSFILVISLTTCTSQSMLFAQAQNPVVYLTDSLPNNIKLDKTITRSYRLITDYYDYNANCDFVIKRRVSGTISYTNDSAKWKDVYYSESLAIDHAFALGENQKSLENFKYQPQKDILTNDFFRNNLPHANPYIMNLMWDALCFESLAYWGWNSLQLNKEHQIQDENPSLELPIGSFENKDIRITWIGITKINNDICAILKFTAMNNPLDVEFDDLTMKGRSHYWGEVYVSLSGMQIEYACLKEDVLTNTQIKGQSNSKVGYTTRSITLSRTM